ncbi:MAG: right-handed parallel beta-helix repeat-containing protein [Gemmatimonadota bacterium]
MTGRVTGTGRAAGRGNAARRAAAGPLLAVLLVVAGSAPAATAAEREISGSRTFPGDVVVPKGETWTVRAGTTIRCRGGRWTVRGRLVVEGTAGEPVRIAGDEAFEGIDFRGSDGSVVAYAVIEGGSRGAQLTSASAEFRGVRWSRNGIGLDVGQHARARVTGCVFESPARVGLLVRRGGAAEVAESRFEGAGKAGMYVLGAGDVSVRDCAFEKNTVGFQAAMFGARGDVARSAFRGNGTGLLVEKMAAPSVSGCDISGNRVGLGFSRRAEGEVVKSRIADNGDGVVVEFSSYPVFRGNAFRGNREAAVRLRHQSAEWEEEAGDAGRDVPAGAGGAPFGAAPGGRRDFAPGGPDSPAGRPPEKRTPRDGTVDFRGNDWGVAADVLAAGGPVPGIHDGTVEPTFEYKGKRYRMDRVLLR